MNNFNQHRERNSFFIGYEVETLGDILEARM